MVIIAPDEDEEDSSHPFLQGFCQTPGVAPCYYPCFTDKGTRPREVK